MTFTSPILITILLAFLPISASNQVTHLQDHNNTWDSVSSDNSTLTSRTNSKTLNKVTNVTASTSAEAKTKPSFPPPTPYITSVKGTNLTKNSIDKFGIKKIYPTKTGGREWYVNMNNPVNDSIFSIGSDQNITKQSNGKGGGSSWRISNPEARMVVTTPADHAQWKNVEITGYVKVNSTINNRHHKDMPTDIAWLARGGRHNNDIPCDGTALIGGIHDDGTVGWKKEIWFTGGYTNETAQAQVANPIIGRWIGWKVVMYNINNDTAVKMESYLDNQNNNRWVQVTNLTDKGRWYADTSDKEFYSVDCGKPKDYIMTNAGPNVMFRSDNLILDFKNLSTREIQSPE
jgi:hypothetical protein